MTEKTRVAKRFLGELPFELIHDIIQRLPVLDVLFVYSCTLDCRILDSYEETFERICVENYNPLRESKPSLSFLWHLLTVSLHHKEVSGIKDLQNELMNRAVNYQKLRMRVKLNPGFIHHVPIKVERVIAKSKRKTEVELSCAYGAQNFKYEITLTISKHYYTICLDGPFLYCYWYGSIYGMNLLEDDHARRMGYISSPRHNVRMAVSRSNAFACSQNRRGIWYLRYLNLETNEKCGTKTPVFDISNLCMTAIDNNLVILSNDVIIQYSVEGGRLVTDGLKWLGFKSYATMVDGHGYIWFYETDGSNFRYTSIVNERSFDVECDEPRQRPIVLSKNFFRIGSTSFFIDKNGVVNIKKWMIGKTRIFDLLFSN